MQDSKFHYTDPAGAEMIRRTGELRSRLALTPPEQRGMLQSMTTAERFAATVVWCTDMRYLTPATSITANLSPERAQVRFKVADDAELYPWALVRDTWPPDVVAALEPPGSRPETWWLSGGVVPIAGARSSRGVKASR